ncbi:MAG: glycosyltransferase family 1 protein [Candidatus Erginobacter occultus]|nr:glycosyltransferase family 1 protein [Candidatus Erginobacter occultus]
MKIGIDIQCLTRPLTGVGYYTLGLLEGLAGLEEAGGITPFYFSFHGQVDLPSLVYKEMAPRDRKIPGKILSLGWKRLGFPPVEWLIRGMDVYHFPDFIARPVRRKPVVTTVYDLSFKRFSEFTEARNLKYLEASLPASLERSDRIIVISRFTRDELISLYPVSPGKVAVVEGGIDDAFRRPLTADELLRTRYRFHLPEKYLLTVGTWEPRKNLVRLLEAWSSLRAAGKLGGYKLVLAGLKGWLCGEIEQKFRNYAGQRGVMALGYVPRSALPAVYRGASGFIYPSLYEGQGLPPLEAMASGCRWRRRGPPPSPRCWGRRPFTSNRPIRAGLRRRSRPSSSARN